MQGSCEHELLVSPETGKFFQNGDTCTKGKFRLILQRNVICPLQLPTWSYPEKGLRARTWGQIVSHGGRDVPVSKSSGWSGSANLRGLVVSTKKEMCVNHIYSGVL